MKGAMNSLPVTPSATVRPDQESPWRFELRQRSRANLWTARFANSNSAADPAGAANSKTAKQDINWQVIPVREPQGNRTINMVGSWESMGRFQRFPVEWRADASHGGMFLSTWMKHLLPSQILAPQSRAAIVRPDAFDRDKIETLADRSRTAIDDLTKLSPGWDGYRGVAVLPGVAKHALRLLNSIDAYTQFVPDAVPLSNGGLQLEWYVGIHEIEIEIAPDCATRLHRECVGDGASIEVSIGDPFDIAEVATFFQALSR